MIAEVLILPSRFQEEKDPSFRFEEGPHLYWLKGKTLWSATGMLKAVGYVDDRFYSEQSAIDGSRRHKATQLADAVGDPNRLHIADEDLGHVEGWRNFVRQWNFRPRLIETPRYHPLYHYGVTPDREGLTDHPGGLWENQPTLVEIKTGLMPWWTKYQVALQDLALGAWDVQPVFRQHLGVRLFDTGEYDVEHFDGYMNDLAVAQCIASVCMNNENKMWQQQRETGYFASAELI